MSAALLCLFAGTLQVALPADRFTLRWTHTIEKIVWEEDYQIVGTRLQLTESRVQGSGAGMEPPPGALLRNGKWHHRPDPPRALPQLTLARSEHGSDYTLCIDGACKPLSHWVPLSAGSTTLIACSALR
jgi:hypothetical protein